MTLYRQLAASIVLLLAIALTGILYISTDNLRTFLSEQLQTQAQDTATSLGVTLSPHALSGDLSMMETIIDAVFNHGSYSEISVTDIGGTVIAGKQHNTVRESAPDWFRHLIELQEPSASSLLMAGWKQAGTVQVTVDTSHAYAELWANTKDTLALFGGFTIVLLILGLVAVRVVLGPLKQVRQQADAICRNSYPIVKDIPRTRELRSVVLAMNELARKTGRQFAEQASLVESLREQVSMDAVTRLGNRNYLDQQLVALTTSTDPDTCGALLLVELRNLERINSLHGYSGGDRLLRRSAELIDRLAREYGSSVTARISGAGFAVVLTGLATDLANELADTLCRELMQLLAEGLVESCDICHAGVAIWRPGSSAGSLLSEADMALRSAQACGMNTWRRYLPSAANETEIYGSAEWRERLQNALDSNTVALAIQPVLQAEKPARQVRQFEVLARIADSDSSQLSAGVFMPMAEHLDMAGQFDKTTAQLLIDYLYSHPGDSAGYSLNLSAASLQDAVFIQSLCREIERKPGIASRLAVEFPEYAVLARPRQAAQVTQQLASQGVRCGIDHVGRSFSSLGYLHSLDVSYIKIDGCLVRGIDTADDNRFVLKALINTAHSIGVKVIALAVESQQELDTLIAIGVDGVQGFLTGRPQALLSDRRRQQR